MKKFEGTRGKWLYRGTKSINGRGFDVPSETSIYKWEMVIRTENSTFSTPSVGKAFGQTEEECLNNAKLFSASPDLLEALQNTLSTLKSMIGSESKEWIEVIEAEKAINKAI